MSNYHDNYLVITANEQDMQKVLTRMALNLAACRAETEFDIDSIAGMDTVKGLYGRIRRWLDGQYFMFAFSGAPMPEEGTAQTLAQAIEAVKALDASSVDTDKIEERYTEGGGSVALKRYGENWALEMYYATVWRPKYEDIDQFVIGLPKGNYGTALFDADEWDDYQTITTDYSLHHGGEPITGFVFDGDDEPDDVPDWNEEHDREELAKLAGDYDRAAKANASLEDLAWMVAVCGYAHVGDADTGNVNADESADEDADDVSASNKTEPRINWTDPTEEDLREIDELLLETISAFPWRGLVYHNAKGIEAAEHLLPGDVLTITSTWRKDDACEEPVVLNVHDASKTKIGVIHSWDEPHDFQEPLACLLPHVRATVDTITPVSLKGSWGKYPTTYVRLDIEPVDFEEVLAQVHTLLKKNRGRRKLSSKAGE